MKLAKLEPLTPGFVESLTEVAEPDELEESEEAEELEELRTGRTGALGPKGGTANPGHGRGQGEAADGSLFEEEADPEALEDYAAGDEERGHPEEAAEDELEADLELEPEVGVETDDVKLSVKEVLDAIKAALEDLYPGEDVEAEYEEPSEEEEVEVADEFAPGGDEVVEDELEVELQEGDEEEVEEGKSAEATDDLVEQITKRVAARILKSALAKK